MDWGTCMCVNLDMQAAIRQEPRAPPSPPQAFSCLEGDSCPCAPSTSFTHISVSSSRTSSWIWHKFSGESGRATTACSPRSLLSPSPTLTISSPFLCDSVVWKIHLASFPSDNDLLNCEFLGFIFKAHLHEISTPACFCISALPGCYSTSLKTAIIFQREVGVDPVPLPFHSFLLINPLMGQIFCFCVGFVAVTNLHTIGCKNTAIPKFSTSIFLSFAVLLLLQIFPALLPCFSAHGRNIPTTAAKSVMKPRIDGWTLQALFLFLQLQLKFWNVTLDFVSNKIAKPVPLIWKWLSL